MESVAPKTPVVLVHGMWSTPETLAELKQKFVDRGYSVYVPRLPYHYDLADMTPERLEGLKYSSIEDYVSVIGKLVSSLDTPPILVGHSLGGLIAQIVAANYECEKLILFSSAAPSGINSLAWSVMRTFGHNLFKLPMWASLIDLNKNIVSYGIANSQTKIYQQNILDRATLESGHVAWQIAMWFLYKAPVTKVDFSKVLCPVLVIGGDQDRITPIQAQRKIATHYRGATLLEIEGSCHWTVGGTYLGIIIPKVFAWINLGSRVE